MLLRFEIVFDKGADDLVNAIVRGEPEGGRTRGRERLRPAGNDLLNCGVRLPADLRVGLLAAGFPDRRGHVADRDRKARQLQ